MPGLRFGEPRETGMSAERLEGIRRLGERWADGVETQALVLVVARRGVVVWHEAFGRLAPNGPTLPLDAIFPISSITKPVGATLAMTLVEEGRLGLHRPVQEYVPEFVGAGKERVMVHHLLTHTSGLRDEDVNAHLIARMERGELVEPEGDPRYRRFPVGMHFAAAHAAPLTAEPGADMSYSPYGHALLGEVIRQIAGKSIAQLARERVLDPLGMADTSYEIPDAWRSRLVHRPESAPFGAGMANPAPAPAAIHASGGLFATALDFARFGQMFLDGGRPVLGRASVAAMMRDQIPGVPGVYRNELFPNASWGYGFNVHARKKLARDGSLQSAATVSHGGGGGTFFWIDPQSALVGVYFSVELTGSPGGMHIWNADLFMNAVSAAVLD